MDTGNTLTQNADQSFTLAAPGVTQSTTPAAFSAKPAGTPSTTFDAAALSTQQPTTTFPNQPTTNTSAINASIPTPQSIISQEAAPTPAEGTQSSLLNRVAQMIGGKQSLATLQQQQEISAGVPTLTKTVNDLSSQLQGLNDQATALQNETGAGGAIENKGQLDIKQNGNITTAAGLAPHTADDLRLNQIKQSAVASQALTVKSALYAANGNLTLAKDAADKAAQVAFDGVQQQIDYANALIEANKPQMTREEQARADSVKAQLADRQAQIDQGKQDYTAGIGLVNNAMKNYGQDPQAQLAIQAAQKLDPQDPQYLQKVGALLAKYQPDPYAAQKAIDDHLQARAQIASLNATAASKSVASGGGGGVSTELQQAIANGTIDPNKVNSRTLGIYNSLAGAGIDAAGSHATISGNTKAFEDATRYATTATRVIQVLDKNMPLLASLADKVNQTGIPGLDQYVAGVKSYTGNNQDVVKYISTLKTLRSEYAQMLSRGSAVTESDKTEAADAIPAGLSGANYTSLQGQLKLEGQNIIDTANSVKNSLFVGTQTKSVVPPDVENTVNSNLTFSADGKTAYIPRAVWSTLGANMDKVLADAKAHGVTLLVQ